MENFYALRFFVGWIIQNDYGQCMEDNSGKKFSLQDWVMKRAANQSGSAVPQMTARQILSEMEFGSREEEREVEQEEVRIEKNVEVEMKAVSNGSTLSSSSSSSLSRKDEQKESAMSSFAPNQNPLQQLQIVKLLTDLGDRLRQSEKEREVLWKEVEICRKQIADMGGREGKNEKSYTSLETQMNQREVFVKELVEKQIGLEQKLKDQLEELENSKKEQSKWQDKLTSVETAAGSAIVRVEDAIAENTKLSKKVEQLSQDKVRLTHKLQVVEEALTLTQDILKAKALVLLTDQSVASKTNLPQTPAWTGDDTLKVSAAAAKPEAQKKEAGPLSDIAASLRAKQSFNPFKKMRVNTAVLAGLIVLGVGGGIAGSWYLKSHQSETAVPSGEEMLEPQAGEDVQIQSVLPDKKQDELMAQAAKIANQIEPSSTDANDAAMDDTADAVPADSDGALPTDFAVAQDAQDKAVAEFNASAPTTALTERIQPDKHLPKAIVEIQGKAFAGDANAQHDMAAIYTAGRAGVRVNYGVAAKWFEESAHHGIANAQYNLGVLYHQGLGVQKDTVKAMELYRVAASNNHPEAQYNLAIAYVEGVGTEYNPQIASVYFEQAASGGIVEAAYNLGLLHENGLLGESQPDEAIFWYTLAADKGNKDAIAALKQLKSQLSMSDEDADRVAHKVAVQKPLFLNQDGTLTLPEQKPTAPVAPAVTADAAPTAKAAVKSVAPIAKAVAKVDPVIVSQIQEQLSRLGLYKGQPDGTMSSAVGQSIKTYQQENGLKVDGVANDDLLVHMLASGAEAKESAKQQNLN